MFPLPGAGKRNKEGQIPQKAGLSTSCCLLPDHWAQLWLSVFGWARLGSSQPCFCHSCVSSLLYMHILYATAVPWILLWDLGAGHGTLLCTSAHLCTGEEWLSHVTTWGKALGCDSHVWEAVEVELERKPALEIADRWHFWQLKHITAKKGLVCVDQTIALQCFMPYMLIKSVLPFMNDTFYWMGDNWFFKAASWTMK